MYIVQKYMRIKQRKPYIFLKRFYILVLELSQINFSLLIRKLKYINIQYLLMFSTILTNTLYLHILFILILSISILFLLTA